MQKFHKNISKIRSANLPGYLDDIKQSCIKEDTHNYYVSEEDFIRIKSKYKVNNTKSKITPQEPNAIPESEWPFWAKQVAKMRQDGDIGVGDTIARTIGVKTSQTFKSWYKDLFNKDCGCDFRQDLWNKQYKYQ